MQKYDLIVIGSGSGLIILESALQAGLECALIENSKFGGTCLTKGCIPSKVLTHPADVIREAEHAARIGLVYELKELNWDLVAKRMWKQIDESKSIEKNLANIDGLDVYKGTAEFTGDKKLKVKYADGSYSEQIYSGHVIIAAGARSYIPDIPGIEKTGYIDSERFFGDGFPEKPWSSLCIIGGGAIGVEFAHIFSAFGTKVSIIEVKKFLVSNEEPEVSKMLEKCFVENGIDVFSDHSVIKTGKDKDGKILSVKDNLTGDIKEVRCEQILVAVGNKSNADILKAEKARIALDERGYIKTDELLMTSQENVYAIGDINGKYQFRHKANYEAELLVRNLFYQEEKDKVDYTAVPWAIFTHPQIARVGMTETQAREKYKKIMVGTKHYSSVAKGYAMGYEEGDTDDGFVKLIVDKDHKIIGAHIIGPHASVLIHSFIYLMNAGCNCTDFKKLTIGSDDFKNFCSGSGTIDPFTKSMTIHPALNELTAWIVGSLEWVD